MISMTVGRRIVLDGVCAYTVKPIKVGQLHPERWCNIPTCFVKFEERLQATRAAAVRELNTTPSVGNTAVAPKLLLASLFKLGTTTVSGSILGLATLR